MKAWQWFLISFVPFAGAIWWSWKVSKMLEDYEIRQKEMVR